MKITRPVLAAVSLLAAGGLAASCTTESRSSTLPAPAIGVSGDPAELSGAADASADGAADIDTVVMIGDSITVGATGPLEERFDVLGLDHLIEAENGKRIAVSSQDNPGGASVAAFLASTGDGDHTDEVWVLALGTNDIGQYDDADEVGLAVDELLAEVPPAAAVVWVNTWIESLPDQSALVNSVIGDRVEQRGDAVVASWTSFVDDPGVLSGDGVHTTSDGADVFAFVVTDTVRAFLDR